MSWTPAVDPMLGSGWARPQRTQRATSATAGDRPRRGLPRGQLGMQDEAGGSEGSHVATHSGQTHADLVNGFGPGRAAKLLGRHLGVDRADDAETRPGQDDLVEVQEVGQRHQSRGQVASRLVVTSRLARSSPSDSSTGDLDVVGPDRARRLSQAELSGQLDVRAGQLDHALDAARGVQAAPPSTGDTRAPSGQRSCGRSRRHSPDAPR